MNVLHVGIFEDHDLGGDIIFEKGLKQNGCTVTRFSYDPEGPIDDSGLAELARGQDLMFVGKGEGFNPAVFAEIRRQGTPIAVWYGDIRAEPEPWLRALMKETDFFFMSSGGRVLRQYHELGQPRLSAFYLNPVDPELVERYGDRAPKTHEVLFTATNYAFAGPERKAVSAYLRKRADTKVIGWADPAPFRQRYFPSIFGFPKRPERYRGAEYIALIKGSKIGVGVSAYQDVPRYSSDRLQHYLTFGTFFMPWKFPDIELFFDYGQDLVWYESVDDLKAKLDRYLREDEERERIARAAQRKFLEQYDARSIVAMMLDIVKTGRSERYPWVEVIT